MPSCTSDTACCSQVIARFTTDQNDSKLLVNTHSTLPHILLRSVRGNLAQRVGTRNQDENSVRNANPINRLSPSQGGDLASDTNPRLNVDQGSREAKFIRVKTKENRGETPWYQKLLGFVLSFNHLKRTRTLYPREDLHTPVQRPRKVSSGQSAYKLWI
jgi:hypothetical protein